MDFVCVGRSSNIISPAYPLSQGQFATEAAAWRSQSDLIQTPTQTVLNNIITSCQLSATVAPYSNAQLPTFALNVGIRHESGGAELYSVGSCVCYVLCAASPT